MVDPRWYRAVPGFFVPVFIGWLIFKFTSKYSNETAKKLEQL